MLGVNRDSPRLGPPHARADGLRKTGGVSATRSGATGEIALLGVLLAANRSDRVLDDLSLAFELGRLLEVVEDATGDLLLRQGPGLLADLHDVLLVDH